MHEILFRGKEIRGGRWIYGQFVYVDAVDMPYKKPKAVIFPNKTRCNWFNKYFYGAAEVNPLTVGQYTGLNDKNGTKIFEGDIVSNEVFRSSVQFYCGRYMPFCSEYNTFIADESEVIGNIYDNYYLLKGAEK